jgi:hypothetical protein
LLEDYNYFINKAINVYINKGYNAYDMNQQKSDDLRVLKSTAVLTPKLQTVYPAIVGGVSTSSLFKATYEVNLPDDYFHILNCLVEFKVGKQFKCYDKDSYIHFGAKRLTGDMWSQVFNNYYMRPSYNNPYFYIHNVNTQNTFPTQDNQTPLVPGHFTDISATTPITLKGYYKINTVGKINSINYYYTTDPVVRKIITGTFTVGGQTINQLTTYTRSAGSFLTDDGIQINDLINTGSSGPDPITSRVLDVTDTVITLELYTDELTTFTGDLYAYIGLNKVDPDFNINLVERESEIRYGNSNSVRMEIRFGKDDTVFKPTSIYVDYLKVPQYIRLTPDQVDAVEDTSQVLEFPDYVVQEIINELVSLLMENASDQRLQTHIPINQSVANPAQQQQPQVKR